jgi:hypothetical protein
MVSPMVTNKGEGICRLIEQHGLMAVIYLGDDVSETDAFRMLHALWAYENIMTLSVEAARADSMILLINSPDVVVGGLASAIFFIEHLMQKVAEVFTGN